MAILGKVRYNWRGEHLTTVAYQVDDVVSYKNKSYRCKLANTGFFPHNTTYWDLLVAAFEDLGEWSAATQYRPGDIVTVTAEPTVSATWPRNFNAARPQCRSKSTYVALTTNINVAPPTAAEASSADWGLLAEGNSKNFKSVGWYPNMGMVPATGVYESGATVGWAPTTARPGDSINDGGLGYALEARAPWPGFITLDGGVVRWGSNINGNTGIGEGTAAADLHEISFPFNEWFDGQLTTPDGRAPKCIQWIQGYGTNLVLFNNGEVYAWGYGVHGQNGSGNNNSITFPVRCGNNNNTTVLRGRRAIRIASTHAGGNTDQAAANYALMNDGTLWAWGYNGYGQLGQNNTTNLNVPTQIITSGLNGTVVDIWATGGDFGNLFVLTSTGYLYACGRNAQGQLGINNTTQANTLQQVLVAGIGFWGTGTTKIRKFIFTNRQDGVSCAVIDAQNRLWTWGFNGNGQLGNDTLTNILQPTLVSQNGTDVRNIWFTGSLNPALFATRTSSLQLFSCGYNGFFNLGRGQAAAPYSHQSAGNSTTAFDTYRLAPVVLETLASPAPYYQNATSVVHVASWGSSTATIGVIVEQANGTKWLGGSQGIGAVFGNYDAGAYFDLARHSSANVTNKLFKRLRYLPSGVNESDLFCFPTGWADRHSALWVDTRVGVPHISGRTGNYFGQRYDAGATERWAYIGFISKAVGA
jgi:alpha-tubulin suppressor-like RCC1 family protein